MPKRASIVLAALSLLLAVAACNGSSSVTPTPAPSVTYTPNANDKHANVTVTKLNSPAPFITVQISTPQSSASPRPGTPFQSKLTNKKGAVTFYGLKPSASYCWVAQLGGGKTSSLCAGFATWQNSTIQLGT
jgi:hypothetical protein